MSCLSFCKANCNRRHHPVLLSLFDVKSKKSLQQFKETLRAYQITGFQVEHNVPDSNPSFRYPLLHWAAVLEKVNVIKMLIRAPFNLDPKIKSDANESVLHRLLLFWSTKTNVEVISDLITALKACIETSNNKQQTPLHVCANYLTSCSKKELEFWKRVLRKMMSVVTNDEHKEEILNHKDNTGETVLHILSKREELLDIVEHVLYSGADLKLTNNAGETPLELAWRYALPIYNLLHVVHSCNRQDESVIYENERRTRASNTLSETKDYTEFFDHDNSANSSGEEICLKRNLNKSNATLIDQLQKFTKNPQINKSTDHNFKERNRKRRLVSNDTDKKGYNALKPEQIQFLLLPELKQHNIGLEKELKAFDIDLDIEVGKCETEILQDMNATIKSIKEMYNPDAYFQLEDHPASTTEENYDVVDVEVEANETDTLDKKINVIQTFLQRMLT